MEVAYILQLISPKGDEMENSKLSEAISMIVGVMFLSGLVVIGVKNMIDKRDKAVAQVALTTGCPSEDCIQTSTKIFNQCYSISHSTVFGMDESAMQNCMLNSLKIATKGIEDGQLKLVLPPNIAEYMIHVRKKNL